MRVLSVLVLLICCTTQVRADAAREPFDFTCPGYQKSAFVLRAPSVPPRYEVTRNDGTSESLLGDELAERLVRGTTPTSELGWLPKFFNARTAPELAWIIFGLFGSVVFMSRMVIQWIVSEKRRQSVVPPIFWWLSLVGSVMLLIYFVWRFDIVGILGQGLPLVIYVRNLMLIYGAKRSNPLIVQT
ncbi:MAG: lipid-A-disaccharide synthase N-terminal domain-containing protein [Phycisphaerae bacterium]|nr:lipid-A-disaccharide synthase N-terminal domain-containing protein [Phycisphaerae bacterium]